MLRKIVGWDSRRSWGSLGVRRGTMFRRSSIKNVLRLDGARFLGGSTEISVSLEFPLVVCHLWRSCNIPSEHVPSSRRSF